MATNIIYNKVIPFDGFVAINLFTIIFIREEYREFFSYHKDYLNKTINHENIHTAQQKELLFIFFYLIYFFEWLFNLIKYKNFKDAYKNISFEKEAKSNEENNNYLANRKLFAMWRK